LDLARAGRANPAAKLETIRKVRDYVDRQRIDVITDIPALISNVPAMSGDGDRLKRYGRGVIWARILQYKTFTLFKLFHLADAYLAGLGAGNPFVMLLTARAAVEVLAATYDVHSRIEIDSADPHRAFAERVQRVDEVLIGATFGSRYAQFKDDLRGAGLSKSRTADAHDFEVLQAKNVLTLIDNLTRAGAYPGARDAYYHLCEYVHTNIGQNMIFLRPPEGEGQAIISRKSERLVERASTITLEPMAISCDAIAQLCRAFKPPFN